MPTKRTVTKKDNPIQVDADIGILMLFVALVEHGTCPKAAKFLGLNSHTIVGRARMKLEKKFGVELFDMNVRPSPLTAAGEELYKRAVTLIRGYKNIDKAMAAYVGDHPKCKKIGLAGPSWLMRSPYVEKIDEEVNRRPRRFGKITFHKGFHVSAEAAMKVLNKSEAGLYVHTRGDLHDLNLAPNPPVLLWEEFWPAWQLMAEHRPASYGMSTNHLTFLKEACPPLGRGLVPIEMSSPWEVKSGIESGLGVGYLPKALRPVDSVVREDWPVLNVQFFGYFRDKVEV